MASPRRLQKEEEPFVGVCADVLVLFPPGRLPPIFLLSLLLIHDAWAKTFLPTTLSFTSQQESSLLNSLDSRSGYSDVRPLQIPFQTSGTKNHKFSTPTAISLKARPTTVYRPRSVEELHYARHRSLHYQEDVPLEWDEHQVLGPDIEDKHTIIQLARMSGDAYALPGRKNWYDIDPAWNKSFPFGWEDGEDGFRGHVFISADNNTVILSIKGTTLQGPSSKKDKLNDNLLFSCCCARVDVSWVFRTVCDCYARNWRCDDPCLSKALIQDSLFYSVGMKLIEDLIHIHPHANIWLVGHSLGGALASLLGSTYGFPAVAFESPGERLAAHRLHLPLPHPPQPPPDEGLPLDTTTNTDTDNQRRGTINSTPNTLNPKSLPPPVPLPNPPVPVTHIYHTGDPIPQGACTGIASPCAQAGYALETRCHLGKSIVFDTVDKLGWKVDVRRHVIRDVIYRVLEAEGVEWEEGREVPSAKEEEGCIDCFKWEFGHFKDGEEDIEQAVLL
ncbi:hypothetical protein AX16_001586 [Volvariella volvacea WC 439]|nr:hypothetical protein AX16_001586 [Volvariella volvacea WC 439]